MISSNQKKYFIAHQKLIRTITWQCRLGRLTKIYI